VSTERIEQAGGYLLRHTASLPQGRLVVTETYQTVHDEAGAAAGWCTLREAELNGQLITDPAYAQELADQAGIGQ
jgi:hypothetical protein